MIRISNEIFFSAGGMAFEKGGERRNAAGETETAGEKNRVNKKRTRQVGKK